MTTLIADPDITVAEHDGPGVVGVGTAVPPDSYSQRELLDIFKITDARIRSVFLNSAIDRRFLTLPPEDPAGDRLPEEQGALLAKHKKQALIMGVRALRECLEQAGAQVSDIAYLCCVTTTGFLSPGISAYLIRELDIDPSTSRLDVVGMGCNAGLNALNAVDAWARAHPGELAVMVCAEACSAAYVFDGTMRTSVVNSLFGDGAAAVALVSGEHGAFAARPAAGRGCSSSPATWSPTPSTRCDTTGTPRKPGSASTLTRTSRTSLARTPSASSADCWPAPGCAAATSRTGSCTPAARRSSTPSA